MPRLNDDQRDDIERLYYDGYSIQAIADMTGYCTQGAVRNYLRKRDLYLRERAHVTPAQSAKIRQWYERGVKIAVIADRLGVGESTIYTHVRASRVSKMRYEQRMTIIESYRRGDYVIDIARDSGYSERAVRDTLKAAGIYNPGRSPRRNRGWHNHDDRIFGNRPLGKEK